jgi:hypothetical protein
MQFSAHRTITHELVITTGNDTSLPDMIIGRDLLTLLKMYVDYSTDVPCIRWDGMAIPIQPRGSTQDELFLQPSLLEQAEQIWESHSPSMLAASYNEGPVDLTQFLPSHLTGTQKSSFLEVLENHRSVFDGQLGTLPGSPVELHLKDDNCTPFHGRAFAVPKIHEPVIRNEITRLVSLGVLIRVNSSEWAAPSFGIPKSNGQIRFVSDFRQLNKHLRRLPFPLPNPQEIFRTMDGYSYCTTMDLNMGFWAIRLSPRSQRLCTIILPWGKYSYLRLPMGLNCSPDIYQEKISSIFIDIPQVIVYIDDILVITKGSFDDHLTLLDEVLARLSSNNLKIHLTKSKFFAFEAEFLGFLLSREGIKPQTKKVEAIQAFRPPTTVKQVRSLLGFLNYYKNFIPRRSELLAPITNLTKKKVPFVWSSECDANLQLIKNHMARQVVLSYPDFSLPFEIYTDASTIQVGSVIQQNGSPIAFYSRKLMDAQTRYTVTELELLSIVETLQEYRTILLGHDIVIYTDHKNLTFDNFTTDRVRRWRLIVEEYGPSIRYVKGCKNVVADFLSRQPRASLPPSSDEAFLMEEDPTIFPLSFEVLSLAQQRDPSLQRLVGAPSSRYTTRMVNRLPVVYYKEHIVVPTDLRHRIISWYHDTLMHPGVTRTYESIHQHFTWKNLSQEVRQFCNSCGICQEQKRNTRSYGLLPVKQHNLTPWCEVAVDLAGPWTIPHNKKKDKKISLLVLSIMDMATNFVELVAIPDKSSVVVATSFDRVWLCRYPRPTTCIHDSGTEFTGFEFQELLQSYGIKSRTTTVNNPQANGILERSHQTIANQIRTQELAGADLDTIAKLQHAIVDPVKWALNSTYHTVLKATPGQLTFGRDMILPTSFYANWKRLQDQRQRMTEKNTIRENKNRIPHSYKDGDQVLVTNTYLQGKLTRPTQGPFLVIDSSQQTVNGTIVIRRSPTVTERINIRRLRPYRPVEDANVV